MREGTRKTRIVFLCSMLPVVILSACAAQPTLRMEMPATPITLLQKATDTQMYQLEDLSELYPKDADELDAMLNDFLTIVEPLGKKPIALVVPHANYVISGQVAAYGFGQLQEYDYDVAVVIASDHFRPMARPIAVWTRDTWQTPLGSVSVDTELAQALINADRRITADEAAFAREHPIEAEIPFIQRTCPQCKIVPVIMGNQYQADIDALANALVKLVSGRRVIIIASSDLSHFPTSEDARRIDAITLHAIVSLDPKAVRATILEQIRQETPNLSTCACGEGAILVTMQAARGLGANAASVLAYMNSGELPRARKDWVTGFGTVMFYEDRSGDDSEK